MADPCNKTTRLEPAWQKIECPTCGMEHRDDCPDRYSRMVGEPCGCEDGCERCDYLGVRITYTKGHQKFVPMVMREVAMDKAQPATTAETSDEICARIGHTFTVQGKCTRCGGRQMRAPLDLGRIGQLAESVRCAAREVTDNMRRTPGGDAFEYHGSTSAVDELIDRLNALEHFQAGWV